MRVIVPLALLLVATVALSAPAPVYKPKKAPDGPFEIDFSPLERAYPTRGDWSVSLKFSRAGAPERGLTFGASKGGPSATQIASTVARIMSEEGVSMLVPDETVGKVMVPTPNGSRDLVVRVTLTGAAKEFTPTVRRLPK